MFDLQAIANKIENKNNQHRWKGGGKGAVAVLCGFIRPLDECPKGIWTHPQAGEFTDDRIPAVIDIVLCQHLAHMNDNDLTTTLQNFRDYLKLFSNRLMNGLQNDNDAPPALWEKTSRIIDSVDEIVKIINQVTFE